MAIPFPMVPLLDCRYCPLNCCSAVSAVNPGKLFGLLFIALISFSDIRMFSDRDQVT